MAVMDEAYGRATADAEDIPTRGTDYHVLEALNEGSIDAEEAKDGVEAGWHWAPYLCAAIQCRIDGLTTWPGRGHRFRGDLSTGSRTQTSWVGSID